MRPVIVLFAAVLLGYAAGALFTAQAFGASTVSAFFPAAGVSVAAMLLTGVSRWPVIVAAIATAELLVDFSHGMAWPTAAGFLLAEVVEPLVGATLVRAGCGGTPDLRRTRDLVVFVLGACLLGPLSGGLVEGAAARLIDGGSIMDTALQWCAGDGIGILVVGSSILLWPKQSHILKSRPVETVVILAAAVALANLGFRAQIPPSIAVLPVLAWAALRLSVLGTALTGAVIAFTGNYVNSLNLGLISEMKASDLTKLAITQLFIAVTVLTAMTIAQEVSKRRSADEARDVEHARALVLHSALHPPGPVDAVGLEYSVCYEPSDVIHGLGGDWYDVMPLPKNRTYLAVGDIVGHGLTAVEDMAQLRSAGRAFAHQGLSADRLMADLNGFTGDVIRGEFATTVVAIFDHETSVLSYCSAGHPPAFLRRAETGEVVRLADANGPVLGPMRDSTYVEGLVQVRPDDLLVMYTDGLVERAGESIAAGISSAEKIIGAGSPEALLDTRELAERLAPRPRSDDVCLVVVRFG